MTKARDIANAGTAFTTVTPTELGYVDGVTSAIQTQMNSKLATTTAATTYIPNALTDAKGDLVTATANDTPARLAVGANGETLVADSSTSTGLRYQANFAAGKNKIINGDFGIWQRGTSFALSSTSAYTADRFMGDAGSMAYTFNRQTFTPATAPVAGYEGTYFYRALAVSGSGGYPKIMQKIEDVRTFAGQAVTLSFWAKASSALTVSPDLIQEFGSGGSATVYTGVVATSITTSWVRYSINYTVPSISGKTIGTGSSLTLSFNLPNSGTASFDIWGVQLEAGSVATAFQTATGTIQGELAACQRYYYRVTNPNSTSDAMMPTGFAIATTQANMWFNAAVSMRVTPTSVESANIRFFDGVNVFTPTISLSAGSEKIFGIAGVTTGLTQFRPYYAIAATGVNSSYIGWSAEL